MSVEFSVGNYKVMHLGEKQQWHFIHKVEKCYGLVKKKMYHMKPGVSSYQKSKSELSNDWKNKTLRNHPSTCMCVWLQFCVWLLFAVPPKCNKTGK